MANTYVLIASNTLTSSANVVTFSNIPNTYTDLLLKFSVRSNRSAEAGAFNFRLNLNGSNIYSYTELTGNGATASSGNLSNTSMGRIGFMNGNTATSNTFTNAELYIPNYTSSAKKTASGFAAQEHNATTAYIQAMANLINLTSAVTDVELYTGGSANDFVSGSSFWLYGIKKD